MFGVQRHALPTQTALFRFSLAGGVDENAANELRRKSEEVRAVVERHASQPQQVHEDFIHHRRGLQGMFRTLPAQARFGDPAKLIVHQRRQRLHGARLAFLPPMQQLGDLSLARILHVSS